MQTIYKQVLVIEDRQKISLPHNAEILCAREQMGAICIWFLCNPNAPPSVRIIRMFGTGHDIHPDTTKYLGTVFLEGDQLVFHVFEGF